ncbi:glycosyltransferase [Candidatus Saccharibacteria bacterium]|nr:glycosyltransferase [Candidatus Saccharibacteria bacterium]
MRRKDSFSVTRQQRQTTRRDVNRPKQGSIPLTIIIPAYNEARTIGNSLEELAAYLRRAGLRHTEVIVSVGKSSDDTIGLSRAKAHLFDYFTVLDNGRPADKGRNVRLAMLAARGEKRVYMDADLATPLHHLAEMNRLLDTYDVVSGERTISTIHSGHRKFISLFGNVLVRAILLPGVKDSQCGFKGFRRGAAEQIFTKQRILSWGFDMEILALAKRLGCSMGQMHIADWREVKGGGGLDRGPVQALHASAKTFYDLLRVRYYFMTNAYGPMSGRGRSQADKEQ